MAIATLIAAGRLDDRLIDRALGSLREVDPKAAFGSWIDEGDAVDLKVSGDLKAIRWALDGLPEVDVFVQPEEHRFKRLLVADMDSTIVGQECIDELADSTRNRSGAAWPKGSSRIPAPRRSSAPCASAALIACS
jgi:phosphoserine phosphatase